MDRLTKVEEDIAYLMRKLKEPGRAGPGRAQIDRDQRDIIGSIQLRRRSVSMDRIDWPIGAVMLWYGAAADVPDGWAICDGSTVNGFVTPNMNEAYPRGIASGAVGGTGGANTHTLVTAELPAHDHGEAGSHSHRVYRESHPSGSGTGAFTLSTATTSWNTTNTDGAHTHTSVGSGSAHNNEPKYVEFYYIVYVGGD